MPDEPELVHGTCVALGRSAALLRGPPGAGKSDLALRFLYLARRGPAALEAPMLVADDCVHLIRNAERLVAKAPETIRGKIEVRGVGIIEVKCLGEANLALLVDLVPGAEVERQPEHTTARLLGIELPLVHLCAWHAAAPIKLALALARARGQ